MENWRENEGESMGDVRDRVLEARDALLGDLGDGGAVVVAHLFPIRAILADALGKPLEEWSDIAVPTGSISLVEYGAGGGGEVLESGLRPDSVGEE